MILKFANFTDIVIDFSGKVLLIDVDGTLTPDNETNFNPDIFEHLKKMAAKNKVYLCSNSRNRERRQKLSAIFPYPLIGARYKKPWKKLLMELPPKDSHGPFVVIGDKFLTDYLFAKCIAADFILVEKVVDGHERLRIKILDGIDNCFKKLFL